MGSVARVTVQAIGVPARWDNLYRRAVSSSADAVELLDGPRGRRLCWELLEDLSGPAWRALWVGRSAGVADLARELGEMVARFDLVGLVATTSLRTVLLPALVRAIDAAVYWQEPDGVDRALAAEPIGRTLEPVARALVAAPAAAWWWSPIELEDRHEVDFVDPDASPNPTADARSLLEKWRSDTVEDERRAAKRPSDPSAPWGGPWWSSPVLPGLTSTTRSLPDVGPVGLFLVEDSLGWTRALTRRRVPTRGAGVFEITGPASWVELVGNFPLSITRSRWHDWWRVTGRADDWLMPDYRAAAEHYDALHLTVAGYLSTAGRVLPVTTDASTMLAGWGPDTTWWLTDLADASEPSVQWDTADQNHPLAWAPTRRQSH